MAVFQCKICGGSLQIQNETVAVCEYCGVKQTVPKLDDERRANMYERANHFRRRNEYDKAMGIYEQILNEDGTDAEAYWSIVLCRYGVEYVEDPASGKRIPTVNRIQHTSVFADEDYKAALRYADGAQRILYEEEATAFDTIQKGYLAISQREEPFDVFICYKETGADGKRTHDSVLAQQIYYGLTEAGYKVFFSRITLESQLGTAYEPYIFAALNSAKVMVVVGTKPEHFNAVWVKNEWSRYLAMIRKGEKKQLIPAYRNMDPYDMPEEFSYLQSQDMSKLGFLQDLIRGIEKIVGPKKTAEPAVAQASAAAGVGATVATLLKRVSIFLGDRDFQNANAYCEKVLDMDPENAEAYLYKLLCQCRCSSSEELEECEIRLSDNHNFRKAYEYGDASLRNRLDRYREASDIRIERKVALDEKNAEIAACKKVLENANRSRTQISEQLTELQQWIAAEKQTMDKILLKAKKARRAAGWGIVAFALTSVGVSATTGEGAPEWVPVFAIFGMILGIVMQYKMMRNSLTKTYTAGAYIGYSFLALFYSISVLVFSIVTFSETSQKKLKALSSDTKEAARTAANYARQLGEVCQLIQQKEARIKELTAR